MKEGKGGVARDLVQESKYTCGSASQLCYRPKKTDLWPSVPYHHPSLNNQG